ncbi:hypothetical protein D0Y60_16830 [Shinella sp. WSJ-2]|nr:hypothetical protein D0Y60_16830 [Shinella sp. WSJ-2]
MPRETFHFYSDDPRSIHDFLHRNVRSAIVRFDGRKAGRLPVYKMTVVLDEIEAAGRFEDWLERRSCNVRLAQMGFKSESHTLHRFHRSAFLERFYWRLLRLFGANRHAIAE